MGPLRPLPARRPSPRRRGRQPRPGPERRGRRHTDQPRRLDQREFQRPEKPLRGGGIHPCRLVLTDLTVGSHVVDIEWDI